MDIKIKRRSDRKNESIVVIEFKDNKDADLFFTGMKEYLDFEYIKTEFLMRTKHKNTAYIRC